MKTRTRVSTRSLRPGEHVPSGEPFRYRNAHGYIVLRWRVGTNQLVECYEHRVFDGRATTAEHVHHINHIRDDNRPENLLPMTAAEHRDMHPGPNDGACERMYLSGMNTVEVARALGINSATVSRALKRRGVKTRPANIRRMVVVDRARIVELYELGLATDRIAGVLRIERTVLRRHMHEMGLPPRRQGYKTPPDVLLRVESVDGAA